MKTISKIGYGILIIILLVIGSLLLVSTLPIPGNYAVKIVLSGSMEPDIAVGSIIIIKPVSTYKIGDVITFGKDDRNNIPTTHRVIEMRVIEGKTLFVTKGDANEDLDVKEVREEEIVGKVLIDVPWLGYILDLSKKPIGFAILIGIPALLIVIEEVKKIWIEMKKMKQKKEEELETHEEE